MTNPQRECVRTAKMWLDAMRELVLPEHLLYESFSSAGSCDPDLADLNAHAAACACATADAAAVASLTVVPADRDAFRAEGTHALCEVRDARREHSRVWLVVLSIVLALIAVCVVRVM